MGGGRRAPGRPEPRQRPALQPRSLARRRLPRQADDDPRRHLCRIATPCKGSGAEAGLAPGHLPHLPGPRPGARAAGLLHDRAHLPDLPGRGPDVIEKPCKSCGGQGRVRREKTLSVNIPPGVEDGTRIRLAGEGEVGLHGAAAGRSLHLHQHRAARDLPARRRQHLLPGADPVHHGGARRHDRGADRRGQPHPGHRAGRAPNRATSSGCAARA